MFRKEQNSSKWQGKIQGYNYPMTIADMDFPLYQPFRQKLVERINDLNNLTYKNRSQNYFESIINWYNSNHISKERSLSKGFQPDLKKDYFIESPSICNMIGCSILAFTKQHDNVLVFTPVYSFYINSVKALDRNVVCSQFKQVSLNEGDIQRASSMYRYEFDCVDFEKKMEQYKPKLIILCNPHNPSGRIFTWRQLYLIVQKAKQMGCYILSDEIMGDFDLVAGEERKGPRKFTSLLNSNYSKIIVANSISKVFNCESVQGGYGIVRCAETRERFNKIGYKVMKLLTNQMSIILTPIIYTKEGEMWIRLINKVIMGNFELFVATFGEQKCLKIFQLESSYLTTIEFDFASISGANRVANEEITAILAKFNIYFVDMRDYIYPISQRNVYRIAIASPSEQFKKFIAKFKSCLMFLKQYVKRQSHSKALQGIKMSKL